ncbi:hypothetical protein, partial [Aeromonas veronii]|uniref:hypothetical protein n=1 Tax=Aeromonas veronii TaxID=654 RepID=UPI0019559F5D
GGEGGGQLGFNQLLDGRYLNRSSHSDAINISDISVGDYQRFMDIFKKIFEETGDAEHYRKMISA